MTGLEIRLEQALQAGIPSRCDPMFRIAILERRERAALHLRLWTIGATALVAVALGSLVIGIMGESTNADQLALVAATAITPMAVLAAYYSGALPILWSIVQNCRAAASSTFGVSISVLSS